MNAQAKVDLAKLNLSYTRVTAPISGRMGRRLVDLGNLVGAGGEETTLAEINQIDPIYAYFTVNERDLLRVRKLQQESGAGDYRSRPIPAYAGLANEEGYTHRGASTSPQSPSIRPPGRFCSAPFFPTKIIGSSPAYLSASVFRSAAKQPPFWFRR